MAPMEVSLTGAQMGTAIFAAAIISIAFSLYWKVSLPRSKYPYPPGPKGEPIIGMLRTGPTYFPARAYMDMGKELGTDIMFFHILGMPILVLNNVADAVELLDKRGANNSDRPTFHYAEIMGFKNTISFLRWGTRFQSHRKILQRFLAKPAIRQYAPMQTFEARQLMAKFIERPHRLALNVRRAFTSVVLSVGFGHAIKSDDDPYIQIAIDASEGLDGVGGLGGVTLVDFSIIFKYLPNFIAAPGLKWARSHIEAARRIHEVPCSAVERQIADGTAQPSLLKSLLEIVDEKPDGDLKKKDAQGAAVTMYSAGQDTSSNTFLTAVMNLLLHPEMQRKAQAEIDAVVGHDRLPEMSDRDSLPYVNSIFIETLRFFPATPLGLPHKSIKEDVYNGYYIPAGTVIFANAHAMCRDPKLYKNPEAFDPERYSRGEPLPVGQWGFGRRVCVGQHLAGSTIFMMLVTLLATIDISPLLDADGKEIPPKLVWEEGFRGRVAPFECTMKWRSEQAKTLIEHSLA